MQPLSIAICGCGPAGLAAALFLHRIGHQIILIERFAEPKPLGSGLLLQPGGLQVLDQLGLGWQLRACGSSVTRLIGKLALTGRMVLDVDYAALGTGVHALGVHRASLFDVLFGAVKSAGVGLETGFEITGLERAAGGRPILLNSTGRRLGPFDLTIDALGSRSPLAEDLFGPGLHRPLAWGALWATLPWPAKGFDDDTLEQRYCRADRMIGVLPTGRRNGADLSEAALFWSLKAQDYARWQIAGLQAWKSEVLSLWPETAPLLEAVTDPGQLVFARYGQHTLALPIADRLGVIGDAAHATSPQLGQGANMALLDAAALAAAFAANSSHHDALADYCKIRRWHVRLYQALGASLTPFYQSGSVVLPAVRDRAFAAVCALPGGPRLLASLAAGLWLDPREALKLNRSDILTYRPH